MMIPIGIGYFLRPVETTPSSAKSKGIGLSEEGIGIYGGIKEAQKNTRKKEDLVIAK